MTVRPLTFAGNHSTPQTGSRGERDLPSTPPTPRPRPARGSRRPPAAIPEVPGAPPARGLAQAEVLWLTVWHPTAAPWRGARPVCRPEYPSRNSLWPAHLPPARDARPAGGGGPRRPAAGAALHPG